MTFAHRHLLAGVGAVVFALLALVSGLDRMSEQRPSLGRLVPPALAANSSTRAAADALAAEEYATAARAARVAIRRDPLEARNLAFLGAAYLQSGDTIAAHAAFRQAAALGKREPLSQIYFFEQELAIGSYARAAQRLDAFLRSVNGREVAQTMLAMFEQRAGASAYLARMLATSPRWSNAYLRAEGASPERLRQRAAFLARPEAGLDALGCSPLQPMIAELLRLNLRKDAENVLRRHCPTQVPQGQIADAEFERFGDDTVLLGWQRFRSGDLRVTRLASGGARVELENRSSVTRPVLLQPVALDPGRYLVRAKVDGPGGQGLAVSLDCTKPARPRAARARIDREGQQIIAVACPDAVLSLWLRPGSGRVVVDRVDLVRINR